MAKVIQHDLSEVSSKRLTRWMLPPPLLLFLKG